jgi:hypothetical protein
MDVEPHFTSFTNPATTSVIDAQHLQQYLDNMQAAFADQLRRVNERLETVAHEASTSSHPSHDTASSPLSNVPPHQSLAHSSVAAPTSNRDRPATEILGTLLNKPSSFLGEHGNRVYDWLSELEILFENVGNITDQQKITFARQCLRAEALRWWIAREQEVLHSQQRIVCAFIHSIFL